MMTGLRNSYPTTILTLWPIIIQGKYKAFLCTLMGLRGILAKRKVQYGYWGNCRTEVRPQGSIGQGVVHDYIEEPRQASPWDIQ